MSRTRIREEREIWLLWNEEDNMDGILKTKENKPSVKYLHGFEDIVASVKSVAMSG